MSRITAKNFLKQVKSPYVKGSHLHFAWEVDSLKDIKTSLEVNFFSEEDLLEAFNAGQQYCATEGKIYPRSPSFNEWKQSKSN